MLWHYNPKKVKSRKYDRSSQAKGLYQQGYGFSVDGRTFDVSQVLPHLCARRVINKSSTPHTPSKYLLAHMPGKIFIKIPLLLARWHLGCLPVLE